MASTVLLADGSVRHVGLAADDHWTGPAAEAYTKMLGPQKDTLSALKGTADDIDDLLFKASGAVAALWGGVAVIVSATPTALTADAVAAGTGIGTAGARDRAGATHPQMGYRSADGRDRRGR